MASLMNCKPLKVKGLSLLLLLFVSTSAAAEPSVEEGKTLFRNICAQCHAKDMKSDLTGPALGGFEDRWSEYPSEDLYRWVRNSQAMIADGHPRATELWEEWKPTVMNPNPDLTDEEIESIFLYINEQYTAKPTAAVGPATGGEAEDDAKDRFLYWILFIILAVVAFVLTRIINNLNQIARAQEGGEALPPKTVWEVLSSKSVVGFVVFALIVLGGYTTVSNAIDFGRQQGYAPDQPIKFSHATHAGIQGIDCQYCHDGARRSKHAVIPGVSTCMNCHRAVRTGSQYGTAEITKIFAAVGYDPSNDRYIENYESLSEEEIKAIYTRWITDQYMSAEGVTTVDRVDEFRVQNEWEGIKESLTNPLKPDIPGPIEWVRIHNLPDHVFFSHEQHVKVGQIECQQCHGTVEEMEVMQQYAPLSMGWCVNCHRQTEVQFTGNAYYETYERYHEELTAGERQRVTVEDIGGVQCQKCHY